MDAWDSPGAPPCWQLVFAYANLQANRFGFRCSVLQFGRPDKHLACGADHHLEALASGADGLDDIRTTITQAPAHLLPGGWLLLEHGYIQAAAVRALLTVAGLHDAQSQCDLAGIERCSGARLAGPLRKMPFRISRRNSAIHPVERRYNNARGRRSCLMQRLARFLTLKPTIVFMQ